jgi:hypothetical protein
VSRSCLKNEPGHWRMFCDVCFRHDGQTFESAPDLLPFHQDGWFIGSHLDACPECVDAGKLPNCPRSLKVLAEAEAAA